MKKVTTSKASTDFDYQEMFKDFEPPATTDGSYKGTMKRKQATDEHLQRKFDEKLEEIKARLKAAKCKVGLSVRGGSIQLQATLPDKPDGTKGKPWQQLISLGIPASLDGLKTAEEEAHELGRLLARKQFVWDEKYLGTKQQEIAVPTIGELLDSFEVEYFKTRKRTMKSENSFKGIFSRLNRYLREERHSTLNDIFQIYAKIPDSVSKDYFGKNISLFSTCFGHPIKLPPVKKHLKSHRERTIPTDSDIVAKYQEFENYASTRLTKSSQQYRDEWMMWRWTYGMLATYGLRPRELFVNPDINWWLSSENTDNTWKVDKDTKTGSRKAFPLYLEWIDLFDLKNAVVLEKLKRKTASQTLEQMNTAVDGIGEWFLKIKLGFTPYDLRHAWAIRAHMLGVPVKAASDNLGHSVEMHTKTYQRWFSEDNRRQAIQQAITRKSEIDLLKDEVAKLTLENEKLKIENARFRLIAKEG